MYQCNNLCIYYLPSFSKSFKVKLDGGGRRWRFHILQVSDGLEPTYNKIVKIEEERINSKRVSVLKNEYNKYNYKYNTLFFPYPIVQKQ